MTRDSIGGGFFWCTFLVLLVLPTSSWCVIKFERTYGTPAFDWGSSVAQTLDGGYIVAGATWASGAANSDVYVIRTDSIGDTIWTRTYGGGAYDEASSVQQTLDGGYVIAGRTGSFGAGLNDCYVIKTDTMGSILWEETYGGINQDEASTAMQTSDGGYIIVGKTMSWGEGLFDMYVIKTDTSGDVTWQKTYGGTDIDRAYAVQEVLDGYVILGTTESFGAGSSDVYLIKTSFAGDTVWTRTYGGGAWDSGLSLQLTLDQGYMITGYTMSYGAGAEDLYLIKTDSLGNELWADTYGGVLGDVGSAVQQTSDGGYAVAGWTISFGPGTRAVYLVRTDSVGDNLWTRTYGGVGWDGGFDVQQTQDGGYIITGIKGLSGGAESDVYLIKTDENGFVGVLEENGKSTIENKRLFQNQPNPFRGWTVISYSLPTSAHVTLEVFDIAGRLVETLIDERQDPGIYRARWDVRNDPSGVYFYRLKAGEFVSTKKMVLID